MLISRKTSNPFSHVFLLRGGPIEKVDHYKYLGIWISSNLTWSKHIDSICCKARQLLGFISRTFAPHCSPEAIIILYKSQVLPVLEYGCTMWDPHTQKDALLLEAVQKFALRVADRGRPCTNHTPQCESKIHLLDSQSPACQFSRWAGSVQQR